MKTNEILVLLVLLVGAVYLGGGFKGTGSVAPGNSQNSGAVGLCTGTAPSSQQTLTANAFDFAQPGNPITLTTGTPFVFKNEVKQPNANSAYGGTYQLLGNSSTTAFDLATYTTSCSNIGEVVQLNPRTIDTARTISVINSDTLTANAAGARQAIGASGDVKTVSIRLTPSAKFRFMGGPQAMVSFTYNTSVSSDFQPSQWTMSGPKGSCAMNMTNLPSSADAANNNIGNVSAHFDCPGDFTGQDTNFYQYQLSIVGANSNVGTESITGDAEGWGYYIDNATGGSGTIKGGSVMANGTRVIPQGNQSFEIFTS